MPVDNRMLVAAAVELRAAAPREWATFVEAMRVYSAGMAAEMIKAPPDLLLKGQGMAVAVTEITGLLKDCVELHEKNTVSKMAKVAAERRPTNVTGW